MKYKKIKYNPYRVKGNILGNKDGNVRRFSDSCIRDNRRDL